MRQQYIVTHAIDLNWDSRIVRQTVYKYSLCQNVVSTIIAFAYIFVET